MKPPFTPQGVKALPSEKLPSYCDYLRRLLVERVTENGGHLASNLGIVEISVALTRVMDQPKDKIIYDTGHQSYVHKLLTGRQEAFATLRKEGGLSGFPSRAESVYDPFGTGHSGTALSAALGFAKAARLQGSDAFAVAVIGDGSFTGGMVFEALNNISPEDRVIVILNDNGMSIGKSVGSLRSSLNKMRTAGYYRFKNGVEETLEHLPLVGEGLGKFAKGVKRVVKRQALPGGNLFEEMGLHYFGPADGGDVARVETLLQEAKKRNGPSLIHLCTRKGRGFAPAEEDPTRYHGISPAGEVKGVGKSFSAAFGDALTSLGEKDGRIVAVTAAMESGVGLSSFGEKFPERLFDTGIAEEHAMTFTAALAAAGQKPVFAVYSTFFQRCVDQFLHDAALQSLPAVVALDRAGFSGEDGVTHHGLYDLPYLLPVPGVEIYAPCSEKELARSLEKALAREEGPSVLRYPRGCADPIIEENFPLEGEIERKDYENGQKSGMMILCHGRITAWALRAAKSFAEGGRSVSVLRFAKLKGFDPALLDEHFASAEKLLFVEEGMETGGFSHYLLGLLQERGLLDGRLWRILAVKEKFIPHGTLPQLLAQAGLDEAGIEKELNCLAETGSASL